MFENRLRKSALYVLGALFVLQIYFVQELVAALLVLAVAFLAIALLVGAVFLLQEGGQRVVAWSELRARSGYSLLRRAVVSTADLSKRPFRRPHSPPAP
jgi:hypothetical protein